MDLMLGTAMWGWTTPAQDCYELLDTFYEQGHRLVDGATNYPINKRPEDFRASETILKQWIQANGIRDLRVCMKVGSLDNMFTPDHNLTPSFLLFNLEYYRQHFGDNLACFMIHWDNRSDPEAIEESVAILSRIRKTGLDIGFSGLKNPEVYQELCTKYELGTPWLQLKHNLLYSDRPRYGALADTCRVFAYGLNAGGLKLDPDKYRRDSSLVARSGREQPDTPPIVADLLTLRKNWHQRDHAPPLDAFYQAALLFGVHSPAIQGLILGGRNREQLINNLNTVGQMQAFPASPWFDELHSLHQRHAPADRVI
jgi:aryl-alcohol dehydrogenase-like predicted oxidoreductase